MSAGELVPVAPAGELAPALAAALSVDLYSAVMAGKSANTVRSYGDDLADFARFLGVESPAVALDQLVSLPHGLANAAALAFRAHLSDRQLAASTIRRRLAALRSACKLARQLGRIAWTLEVEAPRSTSYRDTRGPGSDGWRSVRSLAESQATGPKGIRDLAMLRLLHDLALRRKEVLGLDLADVDLMRSSILIVGKGKTEREPITLPAPTRAALADWISVRGEAPGPLFPRLDRASIGQPPARMTGRGLHKIVAGVGRSAKLSRPLRPHGLRHQAITAALDATAGDVRAVRKFSRHAKLETLIVYDDARQDLAGDVARLVAEE